MRRMLLLVMLCAMVGCESQSGAEIVPLDKVPEQTLAKAKEALPEVKFEAAVRRSDGGLEVRGKDPKGNVRDVEFSATGELIEVE